MGVVWGAMMDGWMDGFVDKQNMDLDSKRSLTILAIWWYSTHLDDNRVVVVKFVHIFIYIYILSIYIYIKTKSIYLYLYLYIYICWIYIFIRAFISFIFCIHRNIPAFLSICMYLNIPHEGILVIV